MKIFEIEVELLDEMHEHVPLHGPAQYDVIAVSEEKYRLGPSPFLSERINNARDGPCYQKGCNTNETQDRDKGA